MKIITEDKAYVQMNDIAHLLSYSEMIPAAIFEKCFSDVFVCVESNRYDFVEFDDLDSIEFFRNLDFSVDYYDLKDLSYEEFVDYGTRILEERDTIAYKYNSMSLEEREKNYHMVSQCEMLGFKAYSVRDVLWFKQGHLKMTLPKGVEYPERLAVNNNNNNRGLKKILAKVQQKLKQNKGKDSEENS